MLIRFLKGDPRAGNCADLDSSLAHTFIEKGVAEKVVPEIQGKAEIAAPENKAEFEAPKNKRSKK